MAEIPSRLRVGLAQIDCRLAEVAANVERHLEWIERCTKYFEGTAPSVKTVGPLDSAHLRKIMAELRRVWREA